MRTRINRPRGKFLILLGTLISLSGQSFALGVVTVTGVAINHSDAKIYYNPVPGAQDYRVYDISNPTAVKYAGLVHISPDPECPGLYCTMHFAVQSDGVTPVFPYQIASGATGGPNGLDIPANDIDWNSLGDHLPHTLVVEAVDSLGPTPPGNLYDGTNGQANIPLQSPQPAGAMLGSNKGPTPDGKNSTNGQGPYTNNPQVIARSQPFIVQSNASRAAIPSMGNAVQTFYDTFDQAENSTILQTYRDDSDYDAFNNLGVMEYTLNAGTPKAWDIHYREANNRDSMPFIAGDHFMDMIFDGATPGNSHGAPLHTIYGSMSMSPAPTIDISGGKILHLTMEVDGHVTINRRWLDFNLAPASDPIQRWDYNGNAVNNTNQALFLEMKDGQCTLSIFNGPAGPPPGTGPVDGGGGANFPCGWQENYLKKQFSKDGAGFDDKLRYDLFVSDTHIALFIDGQLIGQKDIPAGTFPWADQPLKAYFSHYIYHSDIEWSAELVSFTNHNQNYCYPMNSLFINDPVHGLPASASVCNIAYPPGYGYRYSDERHWDNMGFEVLPAGSLPSADFTTAGPLVQPPAITAPQFAGTLSACDVNGDNVTNVLDVQTCVNQAIGSTTCGTGDINKDGACNVVDVQRVVNAALGGQCVSP